VEDGGDAGPAVGVQADIRRAPHANRRGVNDDSPAPPSRDSTIEEEEEDEHAVLTRLVRARRKEQEVEAMRAELAGEVPEVPVEIDGVSLPVLKRKRVASDEEATRERDFLRSLKLADCPVFHGKSQRELQDFNIRWKNVFRGRLNVPPRFWTERINLVGQRLKGDAAVAWNRNDEVYTSWDQFLAFLRTTLADPAVRMAEALQALYRFEQGENQKVRELLIEIERLEEDIPPMSEEERKAWVLLLAVKPAIRTSVLSEHKEITSREQVLASAARHKQAAALETATQRKTRNETHAPRIPHAERTQGKTTTTPIVQSSGRRIEEQTSTRVVNKTPVGPALPIRPGSGIKCFKCQGYGHVQATCPNNRFGGASYPASGVNAIPPGGPKN
jgi:hypothetical protein